MMQAALERLTGGLSLSDIEARHAMECIATGQASDAQIGAFLAALRMKGEAASEITSFGKVLQQHSISIRPRVKGRLVDTCGTGGDRSHTFNISTAAAIVAAGAGVPVVKHGNRRVSSSCGSADVLEALGVRVDIPPGAACHIVEETGLGFLFAPVFHPAFKYAARTRRDLGFHTVFNMLGPMLNPAGAPSRLMGVYSPSLTGLLAEVLKNLGTEHALVVNGGGLDEITTTGPTRVAELKRDAIEEYSIAPQDYSIPLSSIGALRGGGPEKNAEIFMRLLAGEEGPVQDIVVMNAGAAIYLGRGAGDIAGGIERARDSIGSGAALKKLNELIKATQGVIS
jgi:anthranilate phosphoribosyltransferase